PMTESISLRSTSRLTSVIACTPPNFLETLWMRSCTSPVPRARSLMRLVSSASDVLGSSSCRKRFLYAASYACPMRLSSRGRRYGDRPLVPAKTAPSSRPASSAPRPCRYWRCVWCGLLMMRTLLLALLALTWVDQGAYAQAKSRPATASDFAGVFQLIDYPLEQQPRHFKENPWPAPCQFFGHYPDGYWLHQQQTALREAQAQSAGCRNAIPSNKPALPQTVRWKMLKDGFVLIDRADYRVQEIWKVDHMNAPTHLDTINLNRRELIMQLLDRTGKQLVWIRLLRRVGDVRN